MQPSAASDKSGMIINHKGARSLEESGGGGYVNSENFWRMKIENVPADQLFFHRFFAGKLAGKEKKKGKGKGKAEDEESAGGNEVGEAEEEEEEEDEGEDEESDVDAGSVDEAEEGDEDASDSDPEETEIWKVSLFEE